MRSMMGLVVVTTAVTLALACSPKAAAGEGDSHEPARSDTAPAAPDQEQSPTVQGQLTRESAKALLTRAFADEPVSIMRLAGPYNLLDGPTTAVEGGVREGMFVREGSSYLSMTPEGARFFQLPKAKISLWGWQGQVFLVTPAKMVVVAVTGITDEGPNQKRVLFTWKYDGLSDVVARYTGQGSEPHTGVVLMRLYDDGWRLEDVLEANPTGAVPFRADAHRIAQADAARRTTQEADVRAKVPTRTVFEDGEFKITDALVQGPIKYTGEIGTLGYWEVARVRVSGPGLEASHIVGGVVNWRAPSVEEAQRLCRVLVAAVQDWHQRFPHLVEQPLGIIRCGSD